jgi:hypothetical protein
MKSEHVQKCVRLVAALALCAGLPAFAQNTTPALSAADSKEIFALYAKYPMALDTHDVEGYVGLFTEDGSFGDRVVGRPALRGFAEGRWASSSRSTIREVYLTPVITPTAEGATGTVLSFSIDVGPNPPAITRASQYTDTLVRTPQGWRFKKRVSGAVPGTGGQRGSPTGATQPAATN